MGGERFGRFDGEGEEGEWRERREKEERNFFLTFEER
jgi:hypothetical protein